FFDRLVNRHVCILNPASSVKGVKEQVIEGKTPEITIDQARTLLRSVDTGHVVWLRDRAILATLAYTACRAGAVAKLRLGGFQDDGTQDVLRFQEKGVAAFVPGDGDHLPAGAGGADGGRAIPRRACGATNDDAL